MKIEGTIKEFVRDEINFAIDDYANRVGKERSEVSLELCQEIKSQNPFPIFKTLK